MPLAPPSTKQPLVDPKTGLVSQGVWTQWLTLIPRLLNQTLVLVRQATTPGVPEAGNVVLFTTVNTAGKTELRALFNTGASQVVATEP